MNVFLKFRARVLLVAAFVLAWSSGAWAQVWQPVSGPQLPAGAVVYFALPTCPTGWAEANGAAISAQQSPTLSAVWGGRLPDLRGEFIRGWDHGRGVDPGRALGTSQSDETRAHAHGLQPQWSTYAPQSPQQAVMTSSAQSAGASSQAGASTGVEGGGETRPRNFSLLVCIKL